MRLFITGLKHCGKSTAAPLIAGRIGCAVADSDDLVLSLVESTSVRQYYRENGAGAFMEKELEAVRGFVSTHESFVISLGGGAADNTQLMQYMKHNGTIVYLRRDEEVLIQRILSKGMPAFLDPADPRGSFHPIYIRRDGIYSQMADIVIDLGGYGDKTATAEHILSTIMEHEKHGR